MTAEEWAAIFAADRRTFAMHEAAGRQPHNRRRFDPLIPGDLDSERRLAAVVGPLGRRIAARRGQPMR